MITLDELDKRILQQLQRNSALTNQELAEKVHVSAPTCLRRVRYLHESGVIQKQVAILDPQKISSSLTAIVEVTLDVQTAEASTAFEQAVNDEAAVLQCYRVSTGPDFVLVIQVGDMPAYHELVHRLFTARKNVRNIRTFFSVNRSKFETYVNDL